MTGEVWVREDNFQPVAITMSVTQPNTTPPIKEEAIVEYAMSDHGVLVPTHTLHKESANGQELSENEFRYSTFKRFGASSDLKFEVEPEGKP